MEGGGGEGGEGCNYDSLCSLRLVFTLALSADVFVVPLLFLLLHHSQLRQPLISSDSQCEFNSFGSRHHHQLSQRSDSAASLSDISSERKQSVDFFGLFLSLPQLTTSEDFSHAGDAPAGKGPGRGLLKTLRLTSR